jgi:hypothetical protein
VHAEKRAAAGDHRGVAWRALLLRKVRALAAALTAGRPALRARTAPLLRCAGRRILCIFKRVAVHGCPQQSGNRRRNPCLSHLSQMIMKMFSPFTVISKAMLPTDPKDRDDRLRPRVLSLLDVAVTWR